MKTKIATLILTFITVLALGHGDVELGPNGGRILEFSKNETMHGEVTIKGMQFHIVILDKDMKPVMIGQQMLSATSGDRDNPQKLAVAKDDKGFLVPLVGDGQWLILQFQESPEARKITARLHYDTKACGECGHPEWLCTCAAEENKK